MSNMHADSLTVPRPSYPAALEAAWVRRAVRATGKRRPPDACRALLPDIAALSDRLTTERLPGFAGYTEDHRQLLAYGLFFFPQTYVRTSFVLEEWLTRFAPAFPAGQAPRMLDAGAGAGASTLALRDAWIRRFGPDAPLKLHAIDRSEKSLKRLAGLHRETAPESRIKLGTETLELPFLRRISRPPWDLILASYSLNELCEERGDDYLEKWADLAIKCLADQGALILIEPATRPASLRLQRLRDRLAAAGEVTLLAPCPHHQPCPLLPRADKVWCHEVRTWTPPESMQWLNQRLRRDLSVVKWSFLVVQKAPPPPAGAGDRGTMRMVSPWVLAKGRRSLTGCGSDGALHVREILARNLDRDARLDVDRLERGDIIAWSGGELLGDGETVRADTPPTRRFGFGENRVDPTPPSGNSSGP